MTYNKGTTDPAYPDLGGLLAKNKNLLAEENSRTKNSQTDKHSKMFKQLEKDHKQQALLNIQQNLQFATTPRLEEKNQKFQKQLSDLKLSNKNMKTLLTRVNVLKENSRTKNSQTDKHSKMFKQLEKDHKQQALLNIQQNLQFATIPRLEEKIQKFQKQLSDLKLSNKNMKTLLTRVNVLKDKTFEKLRQSLTKAEALKGKTVMKTDNLKTTLISAEQVARWDKERGHQMLHAVTPELCTAESTLKKASGQQEDLSRRVNLLPSGAQQLVITLPKKLIPGSLLQWSWCKVILPAVA
ncbi:Coiled-coil domain-containing protein 170 [Manis javanica]|nr:Coiled-coil domain-containing protein 170 [Manis javanica]